MNELKITKIETIPLSYRYSEEERWNCPGWITMQRNAVLVRIWTNEGIYGIGEIGEGTYLPESVCHVVKEQFESMLIGEDPYNIEYLWEKMYTRSMHWGRKGAIITIISGLEIALWDIIGKHSNKPVYELLGGLCRNKVRVYASAGMSQTVDELVDEALKYKEMGYTGFKMRIGSTDVNKDVETVKKVRNAIGNDMDLMVDAGQGYVDNPWDYKTVLNVAKQLENLNLYWLEEPFVPDNIDDYARLAKQVSIPIAGGENEFTKYGFKELIINKSVDIVQPDVTRSGGILESKKIAAMAQAFHLPCAPHIFTSGVSLMANLHFILSTPNTRMMEYDRTINPLREDILVEPLELENGYVKLSKTVPGLGVDITDEMLEKFEYIPSTVVEKGEFSIV